MAAGAPASFVGAYRFAVGPRWAAERHAHAMVEMLVVLGGRLQVSVGDAQFEAAAGDVLRYVPEAEHRERAQGPGVEFFCLSFEGRCPEGPDLVRDRDGRMRTLASWLHDAARRGARERAEAYLQALLAAWDEARGGSADELADRARDFMRAHLAERLDAVAIADAMRLSRAHFIRRFKALTGTTPLAELRRMRVERARELVISTAQPLKAIAAAVGLRDEQELSRVFRRLLGRPPGYYRR